MSLVVHEITKYIISYYSNVHGATAMITCFTGDKYVANICFFPPGQPILNAKSGKNSSINLVYPIDMLESVLNTLRVEKPVYCSLNTDNGGAAIATTKEPIGENE
jgi:hypothetical protein